MPNDRKRVRRNYDRTAGQVRPQQNRGPRAEVNARKAWVLENWCRQEKPATVLNIGCGQGGDAHKLVRTVPPGSTIHNVDFSEPALAEFKSRVETGSALNNYTWLFECVDVIDYEVPHSIFHKTDVVCCMLAMHYFANSPAALAKFFGLVSDALAPGGTFVAVYPDPDAISELLLSAPRVNDIYVEHVGGVFGVDARIEDVEQFRNKETESLLYNFSLDGTMTRVPENIITTSMLVAALSESGLTLCESINLQDINANNIRRCMNLRGPIERDAADVLRVYKAIRVTK